VLNWFNMIRVFIFILFSFHFLEAQDKGKMFLPKPKYESLFKTVPPISDKDPHWVHLLYSESPNYFEIHREYDKYYRDRVFEKNTHTQNFKYFNMIINSMDYLLDDGTIEIPIKKPYQLIKTSTYNELSFSNHEGNEGSWVSIGPIETFTTYQNDIYTQDDISPKSSQLNVYTFDQSLSNPNILFSGGETGGVFKSENKGVSWEAVGDDYNLNGHVETIEIDPSDENIVYFTNRDGYMYKSIDGGDTWNEIFYGSDFQISAIEISKDNSDLIWIAGNKGLYKSIDGGNFWLNVFNDRVWDIKFKTDDSNTIFIAKSNTTKNITEILKSIDGGQSFSVKASGWYDPIGGVALSNGGARIGLTDADPNRIYVVLLGDEDDGIDDNNFIGIYRSDNAGELWTTPYDGNNDGNPDNEPGGPYSDDHWCFTHFGVTSTGYNQGFWDLDIEVSDIDPNKFLMGSLNLFKSEDGGKSYRRWGGYGCDDCGPGYRHPDIQEIEINGNDAWVASDGGIDYYNSDLDFVDSRNYGLNGSHYWGFDQGWNQDVLVGGRYHNGNAAYYQTYGVGNFLSLGGGESATGYVNKGENRRVYHSDIDGKIIPEDIKGNIENITKYSIFPNESYAYYHKSEVVYDPRFWNTLYVGNENKLWKSINEGGSFNLLNEFGNNKNHKVESIEISRSNPDLIFLTQNLENLGGKLWKSEDGGINWDEIALSFLESNVLWITLNIENELYIATTHSGNNTNKIFKSTDFGISWENLTTNKLNGERILNIQVQEGTDGGIYITSKNKVWYKNNSHSDWQDFSKGLPKNYHAIKILPFYRDGKIRIAGSRGIWERDLYESSKPKAQPFVSKRKLSECTGIGIVQFEDFSILNHHNATWQWDFPGAATVSSTTVRNPEVTYSSIGSYDVTLTVTNDNGTDTKTISNMIVVEENSLCDPEPNPQMAYLNSWTDDTYLVNNTVDEKSILEFSFTAWVYPDGIQSDYSSIFSLSSGDGNEKNVLNFREGNNTLGFHWNGTAWSWDSNLIVPADEWSFVAITVTASKINLYVNESSFSFDFNTLPFDLNKILIGSYYNWGERYYKGLIEEVTFWKRALSDDEIRLSRHLTKSNLDDDDLIAYYQFNHIDNGIVYDKKNSHNLNSIGGELVISDAPVGPGKSSLISVDGGGVKDFSETDLSIKFPNNGSYPEGDIVVSKIDINPSKLPNTDTIDTEYWIINNYGNNVNFSNVESIEFSNLNGVENLSTSGIEMFIRDTNSDRFDQWTSKGKANSTNPSEKSITFNSTGINAFDYQIYIGTNGAIVGVEDLESGKPIILYPNPMVDKTLYIKGLNGESRINLYDATGKHVLNEKLHKSSINLSSLSSGVYVYMIETDNQIFTGKLVVK